MKRPNLTFEAVKNLKQVGSLVPSSRMLAKRIFKGIDFNRKIHILELGAGNGVITRKLLKHMSEDSTLHTFENHRKFIQSLEYIDDKRLLIKGECVSGLNKLQDNYFEVVISSLPLANMDDDFKTKIFSLIQSKMTTTGIFVQYQYSLLDYRKIEKHFRNCKLDFCLLNFPPAFIYKVGV
jgi:phospholipid N-methyltransferase